MKMRKVVDSRKGVEEDLHQQEERLNLKLTLKHYRDTLKATVTALLQLVKIVLIHSVISPLLSEKEKITDIGVAGAEHKDCSRTEDGQDCTVNKAEMSGCCGLPADIPMMTTYQEHSDSAKEVIVAEEMKNPGIDAAVVEDIYFSGHKSKDVLNKEGKSFAKVKDSSEKEVAHRSSSVQEFGNVSPQNWHWLHLFQEEFPRRSPRLQSIPDFGSQTVVSQDNSQPRENKKNNIKTLKDKERNPFMQQRQNNKM